MLGKLMKNFIHKKPKIGFYKENRSKFLELLKNSDKFEEKSLLFLKGPIEQKIYDDDTNYLVSPENLFLYLFGISEPNTYGLLELPTGNATIFVDLPDPLKSFWTKTKTLDDFIKQFEITDVKEKKDLKSFLKDNFLDYTIYIYKGYNPYSKLETLNPLKEFGDFLKNFNIDSEILYEFACECRIHKSEEEIELIKKSVKIAIEAHKNIYKNLKENQSEMQISNNFYSFTKYYANSKIPYRNIIATGKSASYLHHSPQQDILTKKGDLLLIDAGARYNGYCSDITRTIPISGKFTKKQKQIYKIVLKAQETVFKKIKPGKSWQKIHISAEYVILNGLRDLGIIKGDIQEMWEKRVVYYFFPHGIGHYLGLYTHDLPGLREQENEFMPIDKMNLRVTRILEKGMVLTNEPGIYFNEDLLQVAYSKSSICHYFDKDIIELYKEEVWGVRIEDNFVVTEDGCEILSLDLPKNIEDIENLMNKN